MTGTARITGRLGLSATALACVALVLSLVASAPPAHASFTITVSEVGSDVVAAGNGSLDIGGLAFDISATSSARVSATIGLLEVGPATSTAADIYVFGGGANFGVGGFQFADFGSGDIVGLSAADSTPVVVVPEGYSSGNLSGTATWSNETFASLGLTPGVYTFTLPEDTFTVIIGAAAVPMPATLLLLASAATGLGAMGAWRRHR